MDVKGYDYALIEDPVHYGEEDITSKIFNSRRRYVPCSLKAHVLP